eukprot:1139038-Pelagomonas_calceolata.AAC.4
MARLVEGMGIVNGTARHAIENNDTSHSQVLDSASAWSQVLPVILQIPISSFYFAALWWRGLKALLSQCVAFCFAVVGIVSSAYVMQAFGKHKRTQNVDIPGWESAPTKVGKCFADEPAWMTGGNLGSSVS